MIIVKCLLLSLLITSLIYHHMTYTEPVTLECCGGVLRGVHYTETDRKPPSMIKRCFKDPNDWNAMPCTGTGSSCCGGATCNPSTKGGYCGTRKNATDFSQEGGALTGSDIGGDIDVNDARSVQIDDIRDSVGVLSAEGMQRKRLNERRAILKDSQYSSGGSRGMTYPIEKYNHYTTILWLYILHVFFLFVLLFLLRENINTTIQKYLGIFKGRQEDFSR